MAAEEKGILSGQGYVPVDSLNEIIVPRVVYTSSYSLDTIPFVEHVFGGLEHLRLWRIFPRLRLDLEKHLLHLPEYMRRILLSPPQIIFDLPAVFSDLMLMFILIELIG